jgi:hypothetical protein
MKHSKVSFPVAGLGRNRRVIEHDVIEFVSGLPGVTVVTAGADNGAPEVAWGDSFFYYEPDGPGNRKLPFATIVTNDYDGFDTASKLSRPGVFRLNIAVGRVRFEELLGYPPAGHREHHDSIDYSELDRVLPNPVYATQSWISILNPGRRTAEQARALLRDAHARAAERDRPTQPGQP